MRTPRVVPLLVPLLLALAACTPGTDPGTAPGSAPAAPREAASLGEVERTAWEAWHLMQLGFLRNGVYGTNVLVDLPLPQGVRWTIVTFEEDAYSLTVTAEDGTGYLVDPDGVHPLG